MDKKKTPELEISTGTTESEIFPKKELVSAREAIYRRIHALLGKPPQKQEREQYFQNVIRGIGETSRQAFNQNVVEDCKSWFENLGETDRRDILNRLKQEIISKNLAVNTFTLCLLASWYQVDANLFSAENLSFFTAFENIEEPDKGLDPVYSLPILLESLEQMEEEAKQDENMQFQLHLVLDMLTAFMADIQNEEIKLFRKQKMQPFLISRIGLVKALASFSDGKISGRTEALEFFFGLEKLVESSDNFGQGNALIHAKYRNMLQISESGISDRPGAVTEIAGGASNATVFLYEHLEPMYELIREVGYCRGPILKKPLYRVAKGIVAQYNEKGQIEQRYRVEESRAKISVQDYIDKHSDIPPELVKQGFDIYAELDQLVASGAKIQLAYLLPKVQQFIKKLSVGSSFVFKIKPGYFENLPKLVLATMIHHNVTVFEREKVEERASALEPIAEDDFAKMVCPEGGSEEDIYYYRLLSNLTIRQYIEDEFGVDIGEYDFWIQRMFLRYIY